MYFYGFTIKPMHVKWAPEHRMIKLKRTEQWDSHGSERRNQIICDWHDFKNVLASLL